MFPTNAKCKITPQTDKNKYVCPLLDFTLYFTIKTSMFKLRALFRFLCLINDFYSRYVSCMYNISNISNKCPIYTTDSSVHFDFFRALPVTEAHGKHKTLMSRCHISNSIINTIHYVETWLIPYSVTLSGIPSNCS